jgi:hypothetical protein
MFRTVRRTLPAAFALAALPSVAFAQTPPEQPGSPWGAPQPQPQPQPVVAPVDAAPAPQPIYVDPYGRPIGPGGGPTYGVAYGGEPENQPPPRREPVNLRGFIGAQLLIQGYQSSPFRTASHAWGYDAFGTGLGVAVDGGVHLHRAFLLGARVAYVSADGGTANFDHASLQLSTFDFNAIGRVGYPVALGSNGWIFFPGFQLEVGGVYAATSLRMATSSAVLPRAAGQAVLIFSSTHVGIGLRIGYQYAMWPNAAGSGEDLSLAGITAGVGLEVRL